MSNLTDIEILESECKNIQMSEEDEGIYVIATQSREFNRNEDKRVIKKKTKGIRNDRKTIYTTFIYKACINTKFILLLYSIHQMIRLPVCFRK